MQNKVNKLKDEISKENALTAQDVEKYGRDKEIAMLQKIIEDNKKLGIYTEYYSNLLA